MKVFTRPVIIVAPIVVVLALGGCGSSKKTAAAGATTTVGTSAASTPTTVKATGGGSFCTKVAAMINSLNSSADAASIAPAALKAELQNAQQLESDAVNSAPSSIKSDVQIEINAANQFDAGLAAVNYDITKISPSATAAFSTPAVMAAEQAVNAYVKNTCGINVGGASTTTP
jgi:hypothetical protein